MVGSYKECGERAATLDMACNFNTADNEYYGDCRCFGHENVAVRDGGRVVECGAPRRLLAREGRSEFRALVEQMRKNERRQRSRTLSSDAASLGEDF